MRRFLKRIQIIMVLTIIASLALQPIQFQVMAQSPTDSNNLVVNGDFETANNGEWDKTWGPGVFDIVEDEGVNASKALRYAGGGDVGQKISGLTANTQYKVTAVGRLGTSKKGVIAAKEFDKGLSNKGWAGVEITETTTWQSISFEFTTGAEDTSVVLFLGAKGDAGTVYADDFVLTLKNKEKDEDQGQDEDQDPGPVIEYENAFINGDFEADNKGEWYQSWGKGTFDIVENEGVNGSRAMSYAGTGDVTQIIKNLKPSTTYKITAFGKLGTSQKGIIAVKAFDGDLKDGGFIGKDITSTTYQSISLNFKTGQTNTTATVFLGTKGDEGTVFADNFSFLVEKKDKAEDPMKTYDDDLVDNGIYPMSDTNNQKKWQYSLDFSDEFKENKLDENKWYDYHPYWLGRQPSMFSRDNVRVEDDKLILTTKYVDEPTPEMTEWNAKNPNAKPYEDFTTAAVVSKEKSNYGYYEVKVKAAPASITSSFWLCTVRSLGPGGEIDVFELVGKSNLMPYFDHLYPMNLHDFRTDTNKDYPVNWVTPDNVAKDFHVYGLEWDEYWLRFYYDGELVREQENIAWYDPQFIIFDMETFVWHGYPNLEDLPADFEIDYIRVWRSEEEASSEPLFTLPEPKVTESVKGSPVIDGEIDQIWENANDLGALRKKGGDFSSNIGDASVRTMWDENYLYVLAEIVDYDMFEKEWEKGDNFNNDSFEIYIDGGNERTSPYDENDRKVNVDLGGRVSGTKVPDNVKRAVKKLSNAYIVEMAIPWVDVTPEIGNNIGFDVQVNNATTESERRESYLGWNDPLDLVWKDMGMAGILKFVEGEELQPSDPEPTDPHPDEDSTDQDSTNPVSIDPKPERPAEIITVKLSKEDGKNKETITIDSGELQNQLELQKENSIITIEAGQDAEIIDINIDASLIEKMKKHEATLEIKSKLAHYVLPVSEIELTGVDLSKATISIRIAVSKEEVIKAIKQAAQTNGAKLIMDPIEFEITCLDKGNIAVLSKFNKYVERLIPLADDVDLGDITTAVVLKDDGSIVPVPTRIKMIDGKPFVSIKSLTNSNYAIISNHKSFDDIKGHWAQNDIETMASKLIVSGMDNDIFAPNTAVTRAEFTAFIVRGLGLDGIDIDGEIFTDVSNADWFYNVIATATEYGFVSGYGEEFKPNNKISRQEAMSIIGNILPLAELDAKLSQGEQSHMMAEFKDMKQVSEWALDAVLLTIKNNIIKGNNRVLMPKDNLTRAEAVVMINRVLQEMK